MSDLKPCPFCNSNDWKLDDVWASYLCQKCGCEVEDEVINTRPIENAALTAERDHARQDAATVRLQLAETQRPFTVMVEISDVTRCDACELNMLYCEWSEYPDDDAQIAFPGPGCPRYKGGEE